jgi:putative glycosyltransferase (TIGR04372 family)
MDIYLGAKCAFCISSGTGFDAIPLIFRRPVVFVNHVPIGNLLTSQKHTLGLTKRHFSTIKNRELTLKEIVQSDLYLAFKSSDYESSHVKLLDNTPEEIRDIVVEMDERLKGTWEQFEEDESLQQIFWDIFSTDLLDSCQYRAFHGSIRSRYGTNFLRNNSWWLQ